MVAGWLAGQAETADRSNDLHPRTINFAAITATTGTSASTTEMAAITSPSITFRNGRAFRVTFKGNAIITVANDQAELRIRKTDTVTNPALLDSFRSPTGAAAGTYGFYYQNIFINTSGSDIAVPLVATFARVTGGTGNVSIFASALFPAYVETEDIGSSDDFTGAATMT